MPGINFAKKIASIFNSSDLSENLKYDIACRFISEILEAASTTIFLYNAISNNLVCQGGYYSPNYCFRKKETDKIGNMIFTNLPIFEFIDSNLFLSNLNHRDQAYRQFLLNSEGLNTSFIDFKKYNSAAYKKNYAKHKKNIYSEVYSIDKNSITGNYYKKLINKEITSLYDIEFMKLVNGPRNGKLFFSTVEKTGLKIREKDYYYLGIPLFTTDRYVGIIRIIIDENVVNKHVDEVGFFTKDYLESLISFSQLISPQLINTFLLSGYRNLSTLKIDIDDDFNFSLYELNNLCNNLSKFVNTHGCLIRWNSNDKNDTTELPIKGISDTLIKYSEYQVKKNNPSFSKDIANLFLEKKDLNAISFSLSKRTEKSFLINQYFYDDHDKIKIKPINKKLRDFTKEYKNKLWEFHLREFVITKIENLNNGFLVFFNTELNKFTIADVEMIVLATKRVSLELNYTLLLQEKKDKELLNTQTNFTNIIVHQVSQLSHSSYSKIEQIINTNRVFQHRNSKNVSLDEYEFDSLFKNIRSLSFTITRSMVQIQNLDKISKLDSQVIRPEKTYIPDFWTYLKHICLDFDSYADDEKDINVWLTNSEERGIRVYTDPSLLNEIIYNLLDNAVKYAFDKSDLPGKNIKYENLNINSEGNILVSYFIEYGKLNIEVTNWGTTILPHEKDIIFLKNKRGSNSKDTTVGSGFGLYLVKKVVRALGGDIVVMLAKNKTTFRLTLNI